MKKILFLASLCALGLASCDINNVENITELSQSVFPATEEDASAVLAGIYQNLNETHANPQCSFLYYACLASDDQLGGGGTNDKLMQAEDLLLNYQENMTNQFYEDRYKGIARANVLLGVLGTDDDALSAVQKQAKGEALALRAYYYYELASMYGNVPVVLSTEDSDTKAGDIATLWGQIIQDFRDAVKLMGTDTRHDGHLDKYAVEGLMARAFLFYTGMYCNGTDIKDLTSTNYSPLSSVSLPDGTTFSKQEMATYLEDAIKTSGYELVTDYRSLWAYTNSCTKVDYPYAANAATYDEDNGATSIESMFAIKFNKQASWSTTIGYANGIALHFGVRDQNDYTLTFPFGCGWGAGPVAPNLVQDWKATEPNDMRRAATVHDWDDGSTTYTYGSDHVQASEFYSKKWSPIASMKDGHYYCTFENQMYPGNWETSGEENFQLGNIHDLILLRYADVLLMHSELTDGAAVIEVEIPQEDGTVKPTMVSGLDAVRLRAGLGRKAYTLADLQNERRWELACEGTRWNDIRRWHIAAACLEKQTNMPVHYCGAESTNKKQGVGYTSRYQGTAGFAKMPEKQIALGTVTQSPGWDSAEGNYNGWAE